MTGEAVASTMFRSSSSSALDLVLDLEAIKKIISDRKFCQLPLVKAYAMSQQEFKAPSSGISVEAPPNLLHTADRAELRNCCRQMGL